MANLNEKGLGMVFRKIQSRLDLKADTGHRHPVSDLTGLRTERVVVTLEDGTTATREVLVVGDEGAGDGGTGIGSRIKSWLGING